MAPARVPLAEVPRCKPVSPWCSAAVPRAAVRGWAGRGAQASHRGRQLHPLPHPVLQQHREVASSQRGRRREGLAWPLHSLKPTDNIILSFFLSKQYFKICLLFPPCRRAIRDVPAQQWLQQTRGSKAMPSCIATNAARNRGFLHGFGEPTPLGNSAHCCFHSGDCPVRARGVCSMHQPWCRNTVHRASSRCTSHLEQRPRPRARRRPDAPHGPKDQSPALGLCYGQGFV